MYPHEIFRKVSQNQANIEKIKLWMSNHSHPTQFITFGNYSDEHGRINLIICDFSKNSEIKSKFISKEELVQMAWKHFNIELRVGKFLLLQDGTVKELTDKELALKETSE